MAMGFLSISYCDTRYLYICFVYLCCLFCSVYCDIDPFMDTEWYDIKWSQDYTEPVTPRHEIVDEEGTTVVMMTNNKEKYSCFIPTVIKEKDKQADDPSNILPIETIISSVFSSSSCSYRIESYWTYELCHGKHMKQYHGDKDTNDQRGEGKMFFYLGYYSTEKSPDGTGENKKEKTKIKKVKLDNIDLPYYEVKMTGGTLCELTGVPRTVSVLYVCQSDGRGEVYQLKEVSTCQYEVIVLTAALCQHPDYRPIQPTVNKIKCQALNDAPPQPKKYLEYFPEVKPHEPFKKVKTRPPPPPRRVPTDIGAITDKQTLAGFFSGRNCIYGGSGWWRHEFCYSRYINQYHQDAIGRTTLSLGIWDEAAHKNWIMSNPQPKPTTQRVLQLYYGEGDFCKENNKKRHTIVKLKCHPQSPKPHAITLYLIEPKMCEYHLMVESKLFCGVLEQADENGLLYEPKL